MSITILSAGFCTTVQDLGRRGYQRFGMPVSGAMDSESLRLGNILLDNDENAACLETTLLGPTFSVRCDTYMAVTGADIPIAINDRPVPHSTALFLRRGDRVALGAAKGGRYSYIAFRGGLDVPLVMGSRATCLRAKLGGLEGRKLAAGDTIPLLPAGGSLFGLSARSLPAPSLPPEILTLRCLLGPQDDHFTPKGLKTFLTGTYTISPKSDRMGYRTEGPRIEAIGDGNIITDGIALGAIQVPGDGQPIVMLSDRQTTGGYAKIAHVISVDIPRIAQALPGQKIRFCAVSPQEAEAALRAEKKARLDLVARLGSSPAVQKFRLVIGGDAFSVQVEEL